MLSWLEVGWVDSAGVLFCLSISARPYLSSLCSILRYYSILYFQMSARASGQSGLHFAVRPDTREGCHYMSASIFRASDVFDSGNYGACHTCTV